MTTAVRTLPADGSRKPPELPGRGPWLPLVRRWWRAAWSSPVALAWTSADMPALEQLALYWQAMLEGDKGARPEIRQLEDRLGLSPLARRKLQWEIGQAAGHDAAKLAGEPAEVDDVRLRLVSGAKAS